MASKRTVPVRIPYDDEYVYRYKAKHDWTDPPPKIRQLDPDTQVIVIKAPEDGPSRFGEWPRTRPTIPDGDLSQIIIRPPRRRFKQGKTYEIRLRHDLTKTEWVRTGKHDPRCKHCRRMNRYNRRTVLVSQMSGCRHHVRLKQIEVPHPQAGKVIAMVSTTKLYGLAPETRILYPTSKGEWDFAYVHNYDLWREEQRAEAKARRKADNEWRRFMRRPTRIERLLRDEGWL
jgi:hypothetical protein